MDYQTYLAQALQFLTNMNITPAIQAMFIVSLAIGTAFLIFRNR
jgi:hypothetical protein